MGSIFGSKDETSTTETSIPKWAEDMQKSQGKDQEWLRDKAKELWKRRQLEEHAGHA